MQDENKPQENAGAEPAPQVKVPGPGEEGFMGFKPNLDAYGHAPESVTTDSRAPVAYTAADVGRIVNTEVIDDVTFVTEIVGVDEVQKYTDFSRYAIVKMTKLDSGSDEGPVEGEFMRGQIFTADRKTVRAATEEEITLAESAIWAAAAKRSTTPKFSLAEGSIAEGVKLPEGVDVRKYWLAEAPRGELPHPTAEQVQHTPTGVKRINGVDVIPLGEVATPDGVKPFADGKIVGVFDQEAEKPIWERMGEPAEFIINQLHKAGVRDPKAWARGLNVPIYKAMDSVEKKIYMVNQLLRLHVAEQNDTMPVRFQQRMTLADVGAEDWYRLVSASVLPWLVELDKKEREAEEAAAAASTPTA